jgi:hypothetical protein
MYAILAFCILHFLQFDLPTEAGKAAGMDVVKLRDTRFHAGDVLSFPLGEVEKGPKGLWRDMSYLEARDTFT